MKHTKYLGINFDEFLSWNYPLNQLKTKLTGGCSLLTKLHYYVCTTTLRSVYFAIFDAHLRYESQIWDQKRTETLRQTQKLKGKTIRIINSKYKNEPTNLLDANSQTKR